MQPASLAQIGASGLQDLTASSHNLFPPNGEIEWKFPGERIFAVGCWAAFQVTSQGPPGQSKRYRAVGIRPLLPVEDLSHLASVEAIRRLLVEDGRQSDTAGERFVRVSPTEIVRIEITQSADGRYRASDGDRLRRLPVFRFDAGLCMDASFVERRLVLLEAGDSLQQTGMLNLV